MIGLFVTLLIASVAIGAIAAFLAYGSGYDAGREADRHWWQARCNERWGAAERAGQEAGQKAGYERAIKVLMDGKE